jgi:hypothetical protein
MYMYITNKLQKLVLTPSKLIRLKIEGNFCKKYMIISQITGDLSSGSQQPNLQVFFQRKENYHFLIKF